MTLQAENIHFPTCCVSQAPRGNCHTKNKLKMQVNTYSAKYSRKAFGTHPHPHPNPMPSQSVKTSVRRKQGHGPSVVVCMTFLHWPDYWLREEQRGWLRGFLLLKFGDSCKNSGCVLNASVIVWVLSQQTLKQGPERGSFIFKVCPSMTKRK